MTKLELVALELLKGYCSPLYVNDDIEHTKHSIKCAYDMAELFCNYIEAKTENESKIIS
jgi:hypothetical protein